MDVPALFSNKKDDQTTDQTDRSSADDTSQQSMGVLGDPLANTPTDDAAASDATADATNATDDQATSDVSDDTMSPALDGGQIVPNDTIRANDHSAVGEFKTTELPDLSAPLVAPEPPKPVVPQPELPKVPEIVPPVVVPVSLPEPLESSDKITFIKTYTKEFDDALHRATEAAQKILDAIDTAIRNRDADIAIPEEANEFLDDVPKDDKVEKFEDARAIVREVMAKAEEAKQQSEAAAEEAAKVYDEVQEFKKETEEQIDQLMSDKPDNKDKASIHADDTSK